MASSKASPWRSRASSEVTTIALIDAIIPTIEERLGHELALGHRGAHGAEQLDEDEHEEQPVERGATASRAPSSMCVTRS